MRDTSKHFNHSGCILILCRCVTHTGSVQLAWIRRPGLHRALQPVRHASEQSDVRAAEDFVHSGRFTGTGDPFLQMAALPDSPEVREFEVGSDLLAQRREAADPPEVGSGCSGDDFRRTIRSQVRGSGAVRAAILCQMTPHSHHIYVYLLILGIFSYEILSILCPVLVWYEKEQNSFTRFHRFDLFFWVCFCQ